MDPLKRLVLSWACGGYWSGDAEQFGEVDDDDVEATVPAVLVHRRDRT